MELDCTVIVGKMDVVVEVDVVELIEVAVVADVVDVIMAVATELV